MTQASASRGDGLLAGDIIGQVLVSKRPNDKVGSQQLGRPDSLFLQH